jgi:hypothetical protein
MTDEQAAHIKQLMDDLRQARRIAQAAVMGSPLNTQQLSFIGIYS